MEARFLLRICHIASADRWAGAEVQIVTLLRQLAHRPNLRITAIVLNDGRVAEELQASGVGVVVIPEQGNGFFTIVAEAVRALRTDPPDLIHSHGYKANLIAYLVARRLHVRCKVRSQHGLPEPFTGLRTLKHGVLQALDRLLARHGADAVISVSLEMRDHLLRHVPAELVFTIPNGLEPRDVHSEFSPSEAKERLGFAADALVIGTAGRLEPVKRLDRFLAAARHVVAAHPGARFVIAGDGREEDSLRALARQFGIEEQVSFLGHRRDVHDVIRAFDMFVFSSEHEGLPMTLLEAMNLGVPVVSYAVGGIVEVLGGGRFGVLVDSGDPSDLARACLDLAADRPHRERLSRAGRERVIAEYSAEGNASRTAELYESLCSNLSPTTTGSR